MIPTQAQHHLLIPNPEAPGVLALREGDAWALPSTPHTDAAAINCEMLARFGLETTLLSMIDRRLVEADERFVYALEAHTAGWTPPAHSRWVKPGELAALPLATPEHRPVLAQWFADRAAPLPPLRLPWAEPGWWDRAVAWIDRRLGELALRRLGPVEQLHVRMTSTILRVPAESTLYFKAASRSFGYEARVTRALAARWPRHMPSVLAAEDEQGWLLLADLGPTLRDLTRADGDMSRWADMLRQYTAFQIEAAGHLDELRVLGVPDRRLAELPRLFAQVMADAEFLLVGQPGGLSAEDYAQMRTLVPEVRELCAALAAYGLPETLHHDDFHAGNVALNGPDCVFFDWAECALAHPFYSLFMALRSAKYSYGADEATLDRLRESYLEPWTQFAPMPRLLEAYAPAQRLAKLCRALSWHQVVSGMEPHARWEAADSLPYWLSIFAKDVDDL